MTPTARQAVARRRKRLIISQTLRARAQTDPRRAERPESTPAQARRT